MRRDGEAQVERVTDAGGHGDEEFDRLSAESAPWFGLNTRERRPFTLTASGSGMSLSATVHTDSDTQAERTLVTIRL